MHIAEPHGFDPAIPTKGEHADIAAFRRSHPQARFVDILLSDMSSTLRGKRLRIEDLHSAYEGGFCLPGSMFALDARGATIEASGLGFDDGDADRSCLPVTGSLVPVPWEGPHVAQVQVSMRDLDGQPFWGDPRNVLKRVLSRYTEQGLTPVVALELEFYLVDPERTADGLVQPPKSADRREGRTQINSMSKLHEFSAVLSDIVAACEAQRVPATTSLAECGPGQYEVNLRHVADACAACDQTVRLKRIVRSIAARHGLRATFMAKPYSACAGSGAHIHVSLLDRQHRPLFASDDADLGAQLRYAIGGLASTMADCMLLFAPTANSYRRFQPGSYVPINPTWGVNNRGVALRVPVSDLHNRRIEHRVAGADVNPYLLTAAVLAGIHRGITQQLDPGPPLRGNAYRDGTDTLPTQWPAALVAFERSDFVREYLGGTFQSLYSVARRTELRAFDGQVTSLDYDWYLE